MYIPGGGGGGVYNRYNPRIISNGCTFYTVFGTMCAISKSYIQHACLNVRMFECAYV